MIDHPATQRLLRTAEGFSLELARASDAEALERVAGVLVIEAPGPRRALALTLPVESVAALPTGTLVARRADGGPERPSAGLLSALGFAFLGGLILNLMPCVLPVLSLKVLGFVRHAGGERGRAWRHGLAFAAGVVVSFWALAGLLLALRAAGQQIGWGFQLQSPGFVAALSFLFFLIGLNLLGVFEVGTSLTRLGDAGPGSGLGSSFSSGALATVVATPCTAPFMGSALGFGLSQPAPVALAVFTSLALGMAAPYLLLSLSPRLLRFVPKPGAWMETFKQAMGFVMMATVVVLVWIYGRQAGNDAVAWLLGGLVLLGFGAWLYGRATAPGNEGPQRFSLALAGLCAVAGLALGLSQARAAGAHAERRGRGRGRHRLAALEPRGRGRGARRRPGGLRGLHRGLVPVVPGQRAPGPARARGGRALRAPRRDGLQGRLDLARRAHHRRAARLRAQRRAALRALPAGRRGAPAARGHHARAGAERPGRGPRRAAPGRHDRAGGSSLDGGLIA